MLYLASQSPQRTRILSEHKVAHRQVAALADEASVQHPEAEQLAAERARLKARSADIAAYRDCWTPQDVVLGADTVVVLHDTRVLGKPRNQDDAVDMLMALSGTTHCVITAHCLYSPHAAAEHLHEAAALARSRVTFRDLSRAEITHYVATGEPVGRAGAYAIQGAGRRLVASLEGDFDTVVGLSFSTVAALYRALIGQPLCGHGPTGSTSAGAPS